MEECIAKEMSLREIAERYSRNNEEVSIFFIPLRFPFSLSPYPLFPSFDRRKDFDDVWILNSHMLVVHNLELEVQDQKQQVNELKKVILSNKI